MGKPLNFNQAHGHIMLLPSLHFVLMGALLLLPYFPHSCGKNTIGDEGAMALAESMKTMTNLQKLWQVDLIIQ